MKDNIYISSACIKERTIDKSIKRLIDLGFKNIELSGGTEYYEGITNDLLELKSRYSLNFLCHNYFPPPKDHFVLNLASLDDDIYSRSIDHVLNSIDLSIQLGAPLFGVHAGFLINPHSKELGKRISLRQIADKESAMARFILALSQIKKYNSNCEIYIENNVLSKENALTYGDNPFLLTHHEEYVELSNHENFSLLLDLAHLYVSCNSLDLNFEEQYTKLISNSSYIHISDNNGIADQNLGLIQGSQISQVLTKTEDLTNKLITLEVYESDKALVSTYQTVSDLC